MMWGKYISKVAVLALLLVLSITVMTSLAAEGDEPVLFDSTGNYYLVVSTEAMSWTDAAAAVGQHELPEYCTSSHLAVITDSAENDELIANFADSLANKWLGASQADDSGAVDAGWTWVTGEDVGMDFGWAVPEPDDADTVENNEENYLDWSGDGLGWADDNHDSSSNTGYVVEFECEVEIMLDCSMVAPSIAMIWPPNHNMQPITITGVTVEPPPAEGEEAPVIDIVITGIGSSEPDNDKADGNTTGDYGGTDTDTAWVRAERAGNGSGRTYTIDFEASMEGAVGCSGTVTVFVPHDQRGGKGNANNGKGSENAHGNNPHANPHAANGKDNAANNKGQGNGKSADASANGKGNGKGNGNGKP